MARITARLDMSQIQKIQRSIHDEAEIEKFYESCAKELASRLIAKVVKRTPVGVYPHRTGGDLRRGWTGGVSPAEFVNSINVEHVNHEYIITIINPMNYASYVEFGHRTRNHSGWVEGQFMLTISESEVQDAMPSLIEKKLNRWLRRVMGS